MSLTLINKCSKELNKRTSLGEYNFEKHKRMRTKDGEEKELRERYTEEVHNRNSEEGILVIRYKVHV